MTVGETMTHIPKGAFKNTYHNPNVRDAQNYSVVEDLAQTPCAMFTLEVLQSFPSQRKEFLSALGTTETTNSGMIVFYLIDYKPHLPHHVSFEIVVVYATKLLTQNIFCMVVDEGASTCVMWFPCWKALDQPELSLSPTFLTTFDGQYFILHGMIPSFPV
jgi:hypothetical protein